MSVLIHIYIYIYGLIPLFLVFISYLPELLANSSACKNSPELMIGGERGRRRGGGERGSNMEK